jgi:hypothetical protein
MDTPHAGFPARGIRVLGAYDRWLRIVDDSQARAELGRLEHGEADESAVFNELRRLGDELEQGLLALLFETPLVRVVRDYGIF